MLVPTNCPMCNDPLLNDFNHFNIGDVAYKTCNKRANHKLGIIYYANTDMVTDMNYTFSNNKTVIIWDFVQKKIYLSPTIIIKGRSAGISTMFPNLGIKKNEIPWFEPDVTNFPKLLKKLRTYICFS